MRLCILDTMIVKVLLFGILASVCFGNYQNASDNDKAIVTEIKVKPIPYNFEYSTKDLNGSSQFRKESQDENGKVQGRYGYKDAYGIERIVEYVADENGYRAQIKTNEPGTENKSPAAVQFNAQPMFIAYHQPSETRIPLQRESSLKYEPTVEKTRKVLESPEFKQLQNQKYSTSVSHQSPSYQKYTFYGQNEPNVAAHNSVSPVAIPLQEQSSTDSKEHKTSSLGFYSTAQVSPTSVQDKQQIRNQKSQAQIVSFYDPNVQPETPAKHYYQQFKPENIFYSTASKQSYTALPVPQYAFPSNTDPLIYQHVTLNNQPIADPKSVSNTASSGFSFYVPDFQPSKGKQISTASS